MQVEQFLEKIDTKVSWITRRRIELLLRKRVAHFRAGNARLENSFRRAMVRVTGKGNKTRLVPVGRKACEALAAYLSTERPKLVKPRTAAKFSLERGAKINYGRIWQIVKKHAQRAGLEKKRLSSLLRHSSQRIC